MALFRLLRKVRQRWIDKRIILNDNLTELNAKIFAYVERMHMESYLHMERNRNVIHYHTYIRIFLVRMFLFACQFHFRRSIESECEKSTVLRFKLILDGAAAHFDLFQPSYLISLTASGDIFYYWPYQLL